MAWSGRFNDFAQEPEVKADKNNAYGNATDLSNSSDVTAIEDLTPGIYNTHIIGLVLAKESPKSFANKKNPGTERHTLSFTVRDDPLQFINVTCWGNEQYIQELAQTFHIGDIVEIQNPQIQLKANNSNDDRFRPTTPSPFQLSLNETHSCVKLYVGWDSSKFSNLQNVPVKANSDFYTLEDINANGRSINGEHVNLLAAVNSIGPTRDITTKTGKHTKRCEVKLFDETSSCFCLVLWGEELTNFAQTWIPGEYIIFACDVKVSFDDFKHCMMATAGSKTILVVNPDTREGHSVYQYAQSHPCSSDDGGYPDRGFNNQEQPDPDLHTIKDVFTIDQIKKLKQSMWDVVSDNKYGITYAFVSQYNIDGDSNGFIQCRCSSCKRQVDFDIKKCSNPTCIRGAVGSFDVRDGSQVTSGTSTEFSITQALSDHTGTLGRCYISGEAAEQMVGCKAEKFAMLDARQRTDLKWKYLLERCKIYFKLVRTTFRNTSVSLRIMSCTLADPREVAMFLKQ